MGFETQIVARMPRADRTEHGVGTMKTPWAGKGTRKLFLFAPENVPTARHDQFEAITKSDLKASRAWAIKESFRAFWDYRSLPTATEVFNKWYQWVVRCRLPPLIKVAKMLKRHLTGLLNFALFPITNAFAEGFNSKIQALKADARGFRSFLSYRHRVLFFCGKLDLLPDRSHQIDRRTLKMLERNACNPRASPYSDPPFRETAG